MRPAQRREAVAWAVAAYQLSVRRACQALQVARSSARYRSVRPSQDPLRRRLRDLAAVRVRAGYKQLHVLLRREGWPINHKRVYRLYTEEGLTLKPRRKRRHRTAAVRVGRMLPGSAQLEWAMDFMHDTLAVGEMLRVLTVIDLCTRECVALVAARSFSGAAVAERLGLAARERGGLPGRIRCDNGTEFTSKAMDHWAYWNSLGQYWGAGQRTLHREGGTSISEIPDSASPMDWSQCCASEIITPDLG